MSALVLLRRRNWGQRLDEYIPFEAALEEYGVVLEPASLAIDEQATVRLRAERRAIAYTGGR